MTERDKTLWKIKNRPVDIARGFGWDKLYRIEESTLHNNWLKDLIFAKEDYLLQGARQSYKTTCVISAIAIKMILMPSLSQAFFRKTDDDVKEVLNGVRKCLESDMANALCYNLWGVQLELDKQNAFQITTNLFKSSRGSAQLTGMGIGGSLVGKHFDIIWTDDIVTNKDRASRAEREATKTAYGELGNILNEKDPDNPYSGVMIDTGTPWHKNDAYMKMPKPVKYIANPEFCVRYKDSIKKIWSKIKDLPITNIPSREKIQEREGALTKSEFFANYFLIHVSNDTQIYSDPKYFTEPKRVMGGYAQIDCAYGGDNFTAMTIMNQDPMNDNFYGFGIVWDRHIKECYPDIIMLYKKFNINTIFIEDNADKGFVEEELIKLGLFVKGYHENENKHIKIQTHLYTNWENLYWLNTTDPEYIIQITDYEKDAEPDDAPDSCASLLREVSTMGDSFIM